MEFSARSFVAVLSLVSLWTCHADTVAFLDATSSPYLKPGSPNSLSAEGYETLLSVLSNSPAPFHVSKGVSEQVGQFLVSDFFQRPAATWNVVLFGATHSELFGAKTDVSVKFVELYGSAPASRKIAPTKAYKNCGKTCLAQSFKHGAMQLGGTYEEGSAGLNGVLKYTGCPSGRSELELDNAALVLWATELSAVWKDLSSVASAPAEPMMLDSTLFGLYMIRQEYGADSEEFKFAACFTKATLIEVQRTLGQLYNGRVFTSVLMHNSADAMYDDKQLGEALMHHGRSLMTSYENSDNDPTTTVEEKTKRFSTNAVGYVMFLILLFSSLGGIYVMVNMDFTKDTLLYSQAKID